MTDWWWVVQFPPKIECWYATINTNPYAGVFVSFDMSFKSQAIGHAIVSATKEIAPLQAQLYKLVYGRLP